MIILGEISVTGRGLPEKLDVDMQEMPILVGIRRHMGEVDYP